MGALDIAGIDKVLVVVYFILVFGFGAYFGRYIKSTSDFFFSGRKFAWWIIAFSMVATVVGSYSFIKYSAAGYRYGMSSSMSYLNDWFWMPLWMFGWLPIIYFCRIKSVPEYFERRFDTPTRTMAIIFIIVYLVGYIGINFYTLGTGINALLGPPPVLGDLGGALGENTAVFSWAIIVAVVTAIYVTSGGQTAVIMTDLLQGVLLLVAGIIIFVLGLMYFGDGSVTEGAQTFWSGLPEDHRYGLADFNGEPKFSFIGVFWQDAMVGTFAAYFFNQGMLMRFLALKSVHEGRKAMTVALVFLLPIAVLAVGNAGWLGASMDNLGLIPARYGDDPDPNDIFVIVTHILAKPGVFGLIMAALLAALMSTADTLINATSAIAINDIWKPYLVKNRSDDYYLRVARYASLAAAGMGLMLVPVFMQEDSIYVAHGKFVATVTPPMAVCILLGFLWKRFTARAAFATLLGGAVAMGLSVRYPGLIEPFAHGVDPDGDFKYMRALYGAVASGVIGVVVTLLTRPRRSAEELVGLTLGTIRDAERRFKGGAINREKGGKVRARLVAIPDDEAEAEPAADAGDGDTGNVDAGGIDDEPPPPAISLHPDDLATLAARPGDLIYLADDRWWLGGLRAAHARVRDDRGEKGVVKLPRSVIDGNSLLVERGVVIEKLL